MKKTKPKNNLFEVWEYLVEDFMEVYGHVSQQKRADVISHLKKSKVSASEIHRIPCFAIDGRVVILLKQENQEGVVLFDPQTQAPFWV